MEKLKLKVAELKAAEVLEREELKQVLSGAKAGSGSKGSGSGSGSKGSGSGSGSGKGSGSKGSGSGSGSGKGGGSGSGPRDPNPKITACIGKKEGDPCSWFNKYDLFQTGTCRAFSPNYILHCSDFIR